MSRKKTGVKARERIRKANTKKIINKINHVVNNDKDEKRAIRQNMKAKHKVTLNNNPTYKKLKFGSMNVNGMDVQTDEAVRDIIYKREIDASYILIFERINKLGRAAVLFLGLKTTISNSLTNLIISIWAYSEG